MTLIALATAGGGRKPPVPAPAPAPAPAPEPAPAPAPEPEPTPEPTASPVPVFGAPLPLDFGGTPSGLANASAQGCNACHFGAHDGWAASAHATGWLSPTFRAAVAQAGTPMCETCHLPLAVQWADRIAYAEGDVSTVVRAPNDAYDATLHAESVTCVACHVRDGKVLTSREVTGAPHPTEWRAELTSSTLCATCHQLVWPGADQPLYDTYGEWERSPYGQAGVQCQDCHMGPGAGASGVPDHAFHDQGARAVTLLVDLEAPHLVRGGGPARVQLRLQNTGAGHAFPTGYPFKVVVLEAWLEGPPKKTGGEPIKVAPFKTELGRVLEPEPPWKTIADTRLQPGGERAWIWEPELATEASTGPWTMVVRLTRSVAGATQPPMLERRIPLVVE